MLFDSAPIMMLICDATGVVTEVSHFFAERLGYQRTEVAGTRLSCVLASESATFLDQAFYPALLTGKKLMSASVEFSRADGSRLPLEMSAIALRDRSGVLQRALMIYREAEDKQRITAPPVQHEHGERLGRLMSGVAHDFSNVLSVIQGNLEMLQDDPGDPDKEIYLTEALQAARRATTMTRQLLSFGQQDGARPRTTDLNELVRRSEGRLSRLVPDTVVVEMMTTNGLWPVRVNHGQLDAAILNLVKNATQAMPDGGTMTIETANIQISTADEAEGHDTLQPGRYVMLSISDTGVGIPQALYGRVFEPYFSGSETGKGAGLGLSMVQGFMAQAGGAVRLYSEEGFGTSLRLYFPARSGTALAEGTADDPGEGETQVTPKIEVLVVEDHDDVRRVLAAQLTSQGYRVHQASNGDFAAALFENGLRPAVLITDLVMPGQLQGGEMAEAMRSQHPDLKVIFLTGYGPNTAKHTAEPDRQLLKPVSRATLIAAVESVVS